MILIYIIKRIILWWEYYYFKWDFLKLNLSVKIFFFFQEFFYTKKIFCRKICCLILIIKLFFFYPSFFGWIYYNLKIIFEYSHTFKKNSRDSNKRDLGWKKGQKSWYLKIFVRLKLKRVEMSFKICINAYVGAVI